MTQTRTESEDPGVCPYCGHPIVRRVVEQIRAREQQEKARVTAEVESAQRATLREAEQAREKLAADLQAAQEREKQMPQLVEERVAQERERISAEAESAQQTELREAEQARNGLEQQLRLIQDRLERSQKTAGSLQRQLEESRAPHETGGLAEEELERVLKDLFRTDDISRISKGASGADVSHHVMDDGVDCGVILYECKNTKTWQSSYVSKLRNDRTEAGAAYAFLVSTVFPAKAEGLHVEEDIPIVHPRYVPHVVPLIRDALVKAKRAEVSGQNAGYKLEDLLSFLTGDGFTNRVKEMTTALIKLEDLQQSERRSHERVWKKQSGLVKLAHTRLDQVDTEISKILMGNT